MPRYPVTALGYVAGRQLLQAPWGVISMPSDVGHEAGAQGELVIEPGTDCTVAQAGQLAVIDCNRFQLAVLLPRGTLLPQRAALSLRMPPVEVDEGVEREPTADGGQPVPPCPPVSREELLQLIQSGCCPQ